MNQVIRDLYDRYNVPAVLRDQKMARFDRNPDIADEFAYWITNGTFQQQNPVRIEGYTAEGLAEQYPVLKGDGAFEVLIELREHPQQALARIRSGFKQK